MLLCFVGATFASVVWREGRWWCSHVVVASPSLENPTPTPPRQSPMSPFTKVEGVSRVRFPSLPAHAAASLSLHTTCPRRHRTHSTGRTTGPRRFGRA